MGKRLPDGVFERDGSLRDIYVLGTTISDWEAAWPVVQRWEPAATFTLDGRLVPLPSQAASAFDLRKKHGVRLGLKLGRLDLNCYFFSLEEIEFDLDPQQVKDEDDVALLEGFMTLLGRVTGKAVLLTPENGRDVAFARFEPDVGRVVWAAAMLSQRN